MGRGGEIRSGLWGDAAPLFKSGAYVAGAEPPPPPPNPWTIIIITGIGLRASRASMLGDGG